MNKRPYAYFVAASSALLGAVVLLLMALPGNAFPSFINTWRTLYPSSSSDDNVDVGTGSVCGLCHFDTNGGGQWNPYGWKIREGLDAGQSLSTAIQNAEPFDSDGDPTGSTNLVEVSSDTQPGWTPGPNNTLHTTSGSQGGQMPLAGIVGNLDPCGIATNYCTAGTTTNGCNASMSMVGTPSASNAGPCDIIVGALEGAKAGIVFYGLDRNAAPWGAGTSFLCVKSPTQRTGVQNSGGTAGVCNGQLSIDINAYWAANPTALGQPITAGMLVDFQGWFRDPPAPKTTNLSDAIEVIVCP